MTQNNIAIREVCEELRSGKYQQGKHELASIKDGVVCHCIWGVICEVAAKHGIVEKVEDKTWIEYDGYSVMPPDEVEYWIGIEQGDVFHVENFERPRTLMQMNDGLNLSFEQIAEVLEARYLDSP